MVSESEDIMQVETVLGFGIRGQQVESRLSWFRNRRTAGRDCSWFRNQRTAGRDRSWFRNRWTPFMVSESEDSRQRSLLVSELEVIDRGVREVQGDHHIQTA